jgi:PhnB protein
MAKKSVKKNATKKTVKKAAKKQAVKTAAPKSTKINPYLTFNGNCEEAFQFYRSVFGGKFGFVGRFRDMPREAGQPAMSAALGEKIMHMSFPISKETILMGSDTAEGMGPAVHAGNNFSLSVTAGSKSEAAKLFQRLSAGGNVTMPIADAFWGSYFGMLTDKFGINWMVSFDKNSI